MSTFNDMDGPSERYERHVVTMPKACPHCGGCEFICENCGYEGWERTAPLAADVKKLRGDIAALLAEVATLREALKGFTNRHTSASRGDYAPCRCYQCQVARAVLGVSRLTEEPK